MGDLLDLIAVGASVDASSAARDAAANSRDTKQLTMMGKSEAFVGFPLLSMTETSTGWFTAKRSLDIYRGGKEKFVPVGLILEFNEVNNNEAMEFFSSDTYIDEFKYVGPMTRVNIFNQSDLLVPLSAKEVQERIHAAIKDIK